MMISETYLSYQIGSVKTISEAQKQALIREFTRPPEMAETRLSGRIRPQITKLEGFGRVIVKHYFRGGVLRHLNRRTYLKTGKTRSAAEFEILTHLRNIGACVPEPVVFASITKGGFFYHAWLVLKEVPDAETLADLSRSAPERAKAILPDVSGQVKRLIRNDILHVDLHPGNVLVDGDNRVFLIDFDRAQAGKKNQSRLAGYYMKRWRRAVTKHKLPGFLEKIEISGK